MAEQDLEALDLVASKEIGFYMCRGKLAEVLEKILKAELIRTGWTLRKTHDLDLLLDELMGRNSDLGPTVEPLCDALAEVYFSDRYPGFDLEDPDWSSVRQQLGKVRELLTKVKGRLLVTTTRQSDPPPSAGN
jgi:HEPN domain-containing protein